MALNRKGQGLPINTIILIAVGLLILVLLITFVLGGFKGLGAASPSSSTLSAFQSTCSSYSTISSSLGLAEWCRDTVPNPSGSGVYNCYSVLSDSPGALNPNSTTIVLSNGTSVSYSTCLTAGYS